MKIETLDQALLAHNKVRRLDAMVRGWRFYVWFGPTLLPLVASILWVFSMGHPGLVLIWFSGIAYAVWFGWMGIRANRYQDALFIYIQREQLPIGKIVEAERLGIGDEYLSRAMAIIECEECHMAGECPLCGAE